MMRGFGASKQNILEKYDTLTSVERTVADYFLKNEREMDFSSKNISNVLHVSEATLSRFAKKCGYKGYREFIFDYEKELKKELQEQGVSALTRKVRKIYERLMEESFQLLDERKVEKAALLMSTHSRVLVCGMGSSGYAAREFQLRFMRLGMDIQAMTDSQMIQMSGALMSEQTLLIAITLSGKTTEILEVVQAAREKEAKIILITASKDTALLSKCDLVFPVASAKNLDAGILISPQFPILVLVDVLYSYYFEHDPQTKLQNYYETVSAIKRQLLT